MASAGPIKKLSIAARALAAIAGPPLRKSSPRPGLPQDVPPRSFQFGDIVLHQLIIGHVRIRQSHRALPETLADSDDAFRFLAMMADRQTTGWIDCTAWIIQHPEKTILVDTGETADFGSPDYLAALPGGLGYVYPRIIDGLGATGDGLAESAARVGCDMREIDLCVLTHTHSDHVGNVPLLPAGLQIVVSEGEFAATGQNGRLTSRLPRDGRLQTTQWTQTHPVFEQAMPLTSRGDVYLVPTPGHTPGHQSVVIDLGGRQIVVAGDAAFDDDQVQNAVLPGIVESRAQTLATYERLARLRQLKPTLTLFTHDGANAEKLRAFERAGTR